MIKFEVLITVFKASKNTPNLVLLLIFKICQPAQHMARHKLVLENASLLNAMLLATLVLVALLPYRKLIILVLIQNVNHVAMAGTWKAALANVLTSTPAILILLACALLWGRGVLTCTSAIVTKCKAIYTHPRI